MLRPSVAGKEGSGTPLTPGTPGGGGGGGGGVTGPGTAPQPRPSPGAAPTYNPNPSPPDARLLLVLGPAYVPMAAVGGHLLLGTVTTGLVLAHMLSSIGLDEASVACAMATALGCVVAVYARALSVISLAESYANLFLLLNLGLVVCTSAMWGALRYRWVRREFPGVAVTLERAVHAVAPVPSAVVVTWGYAALHGVDQAGNFLALALAVGYFALGTPRRSAYYRGPTGSGSHRSGGALDTEVLVQSRPGAALLTAAFLAMPAVVQFAVHHRGFVGGDLHAMTGVAVAATLPFLLLRVFGGAEAWWFLGLGEAGTSRLLHVLTPAALAVLAACFEYRVIFGSYAHYITLPAPYDKAVVTTALYGGLLLLYVHFATPVRTALPATFFTAVLTGASVLTGLAAGLPLPLLPVLALACAALAHYRHTRSLHAYLAFASLASLLAAWRIYVALWHLNVPMATRIVVPWTTHTLSLVLMVLVSLAVFLPGISAGASSTGSAALRLATGCCLSGLAVVVACVEQVMFDEFDDAYPGLLVIATSWLGIAVADRLGGGWRAFLPPTSGSPAAAASVKAAAPRWSVAVCGAVCAGKLALLLHPVPWAVPTGTALAAALLPQVLASPGDLSRTACGLISAALGAVCLASRGTVLLRIAEVLGVVDGGLDGEYGSGGGGAVTLGLRHEDDYVALASGTASTSWALALLVWGVGMLPIATRLHPHWPAARKGVAMVLAAGALVLAIAPPMDYGLVHREVAASLAGEVDPVVAMAPGSEYARPGWPRWSLWFGCMVGVSAVTRTVPLPRSDTARFLSAIAGGFSLGVFYAGAYLPPTAAVYALSAASVSVFALVAVFTHLPTSGSHRAMPYAYALGCATFPALWSAVGSALAPRGGAVGADARAALTTARAAVLALHAALQVATALDIKWTVSRLTASKSARASAQPGGADAAVMRRTFGAQRATTVGARPFARDLDPERQWMPPVGNAAAVAGFAASVLLNVAYLGGSVTCVFFLAPLLLSLSRDPRWLPGLTERRRYFPLVAVTSASLTASALWHAVGRHALERSNLLPLIAASASSASASGHASEFSALAAARDVALLAVTSATHWHVNRFFWAFERAEGSGWLWMALLPLQVLPIVAGGSPALRLLGAVGLVAGCTVIYVAKAIRDEGQRFI